MIINQILRSTVLKYLPKFNKRNQYNKSSFLLCCTLPNFEDKILSSNNSLGRFSAQYLIDQASMRKCSELVKENSCKGSIFVEINAGSNTFSNYLQNDSFYYKYIKLTPHILQNENKDLNYNFEVDNDNIYNFGVDVYNMISVEETISKLLEQNSVMEMNTSFALTSFCHVNTKFLPKFIFNLINSLTSETSLLNDSKSNLFLFLTEKEAQSIKRDVIKGDRATLSCLLMSLFFESRIIQKFPAESFNIQKFSKRNKLNGKSYLLLTQLKLSKVGREIIQDANSFIGCLFLTKVLLKSRGQRLIPKFEIFCPGFGLDLLEMEYTMMQNCGDIKILDIPKIFQHLSTFSTFKDSPASLEFQQFKENSYRGYV